MNDADFRLRIIKNIEHIGSSPVLSLKIMEEVNKLDADLTTITSLLMDDPTICAQVLKVANSPYFLTRERINTISQAVVNLGLDNIKQVLFAIEIIGVFKAEFYSKKFSEELFWRHSIATGFLASALGRSKKYSLDPETLNIAGILRNIGVLAVRQFLPAEFEEILDMMEKKKTDFHSASRKVIGINQREIACLIGKKWKLPDTIVDSLGEGEFISSDIEKSLRIREVIAIAEAMLAVKHYGAWDPFCRHKAKTDLENMDALSEKVFEQVDDLYKKLWG